MSLKKGREKCYVFPSFFYESNIYFTVSEKSLTKLPPHILVMSSSEKPCFKSSRMVAW